MFSNENSQKFLKWYECIGKERNNKRIVIPDAQIVCSTEHIIDDSSRYEVIINYSKKDIKSILKIDDAWKISEVYRGNLSDNNLIIGACDAAVVKLIKK